jgi:YD repeat-containing protein
LSQIKNALDNGSRIINYTISTESVTLQDGPVTNLVVRAQDVTEPDGGKISYFYTGAHGAGPVGAIVTDARNIENTYQLNRYGAVESQTGPAGTRRTTWDFVAAQPATETDVLGSKHTYTYDANGNKTSDTVEYAGKSYTQTWTFKPTTAFTSRFIKDRVATATDGRGNSSQYGYDTNGNVILHTCGSVSESWDVASNGDITNHRDFRGNEVTQSFDAYALQARRQAKV